MARGLLVCPVMRLAFPLLTLSFTGCLAHLPGAGDDAVETVPAPGGTYLVASRIDITIEALLPEPAAIVVESARDFSTEPGHALISLADRAGVPAVGTIRDYLPSYLEGKLEGWIDDEIAKVTVEGVPITQVAGEFAALAETALTEVAIESELAIDAGIATHRLTALDLAPAGLPARIALGSLPSDLASATTSARAAGSTILLGDHRFGLAYGEYAWRALEAACTARYGADLRHTLGAAVDCPGLASAVSGRCALGVCVGHAAELTQICEAGLDEVVGRMHDKLAALRFDAIHFSGGTAKLEGEALTGGVWTAEINAGQGLRHVPATFSATRR